MYMEIYVHPSIGDDGASGTQAHPYRTVAKAVYEVCALSESVNENEEYNINIMLGCGVNKVDSSIYLKSINKCINLTFKPWDDMYTALSCAKRINGFDFEYDENSGLYTYKSESCINGLCVNGIPATSVESIAHIMPGEVYIDGHMLYYLPRNNEDIRYSLTELTGSHAMFCLCAVSGVTFENIEFSGAGEGSDAFINLEKCSDIAINNCRFKNSASESVRCFNCPDNIKICNCEFVNISAHCLDFADSSDILITNNYFDSCPEACIALENCKDAVILSSTFSDTSLPVCLLDDTVDVTFEKCRIENPGSGNVILDDKYGKCKLKFSGNYIFALNTHLEAVINNGISHNEFTYNNVMVTDGFCEHTNGSEFAFDYFPTQMHSMKQPNNSDLSIDMKNIVNSAGYRKIIRNYGDII